MKSQIITYADIKLHKKKWEGKRTVLVGGCFDVLHYGHVTFLQKAKAQGDTLIIALESDAFIKHAKHREPVHRQEERAYILSALKMVDYVILLPLFSDEAGYNRLVLDIKPSVIAVTEGDTALEKKRIHAEQVGAIISVVTPLLSTFSTTSILHYENFHRSGDSKARR